MNNSSYIDNYERPLSRLHDGSINHIQFLEETGFKAQFEDWCRLSHLDADEDSAELFFDQHGFEDSAIIKEIIEPIEA